MQQISDEKALRMVELESARYVSDIGLMDNLSIHYSISVSSYILCSYMALPVKTIIVGERPYSTDIHPTISSAMSYDPEKSRPTPSTMGLAADLSSTVSISHLEAERWFRDSWKYLNSGTVVVNCNTFLPYSSPHSLSEIVPFQRWVRSLIDYTIKTSDVKVTVVCMGVPSSNVMDSVLKSLGSTRSRVKKMTYPNPAVWSKRKQGDYASRNSTFGKKDTTKAIFSAIQRSKDLVPLAIEDYIAALNNNMADHASQINRLMEAGTNVAAEMEDAFKELESNHKLPSVKDAMDEFKKALIEYRDTVIKDMVSYRVTMVGDNSSRVGKSTEWGSKKPWKKAVASVGTSSKMSVVSEEADGEEQTFIDDDDAPAVPESKPAESLPAAPKDVKKKKKVVKKVVRKRQSVPTTMGSHIDEAGVSALRVVLYYLHDMFQDMSKTLQEDVRKSLETGKAESENVGTIVDTAAMDYKSTGSTPSMSLGIDDGVVSDTCTLPKLLEKLVERGG